MSRFVWRRDRWDSPREVVGTLTHRYEDGTCLVRLRSDRLLVLPIVDHTYPL